MIKLKNLWKIALATMAMSAMLVACDTTSGGGSDNGESSEEKKILAPGGEGVYSYTLNVADIAGAWGGNAKAPVFSVVLLTDAQFAACKTAGDFKLAPADAPEYQIAAYDNMKVLSTEDSGNYAIYGANPVNDVFQYYDCAVATIDDDGIFTLTVDMTKIYMTDLKALWTGGGEGFMTNDDMVDLTGYKPYVIALGQSAKDTDNYVFTAWSADVMKMKAGATLPANPTKNAPVVPKVSEMKVVCSNLGNVAITFSGDVATFEFTFDSAKLADWGDPKGLLQFGVCSDEGWAEKYTGAEIKALDKEVALVYNAGNNNKVAADVLEEGKTYVVTINAKNKTVKVSAK